MSYEDVKVFFFPVEKQDVNVILIMGYVAEILYTIITMATLCADRHLTFFLYIPLLLMLISVGALFVFIDEERIEVKMRPF